MATRADMRTTAQTESASDFDVLVRLIEYAMAEAERQGAFLCRAHLSEALDALRESDTAIESLISEMCSAARLSS